MAELGLSFGNVAGTYDRVRPPWRYTGPLSRAVRSLAALPDDERAALFARVRPLPVRLYRLPLRHELIWTRFSR